MKTSILPLTIAMLAVVAHAAPVAPSHDIESHPSSVIPDDLQKRQTAKGSSVERVGTRKTDSLKRDAPPTPAEGASEAAVKTKRGMKTLIAAGTAGGVFLDRMVFQKIWPTLDLSSLPPYQAPPASDPSTPPSSKSTPPSSKSTPPPDQSTPPSSKSTPPPDQSTPPSSKSTPPSSKSTPPPDQSTPPSSKSTPPPDQSTPPPDQSTPPSSKPTPPYGQYVPPYGQYVPPYGQYVPPYGQYVPPSPSPNKRSLSEEKDANIIRMKQEQLERLVANGVP